MYMASCCFHQAGCPTKIIVSYPLSRKILPNNLRNQTLARKTYPSIRDLGDNGSRIQSVKQANPPEVGWADLEGIGSP